MILVLYAGPHQQIPHFAVRKSVNNRIIAVRLALVRFLTLSGLAHLLASDAHRKVVQSDLMHAP